MENHGAALNKTSGTTLSRLSAGSGTRGFAQGKGEPEDYIQAKTDELGNPMKEDYRGPEGSYDNPLSVGVGRAEWYHCGWHMCTAVAGPALLGLPFAMASLGWPGGTVALMMGYFVTLYTSWAMTELCEINGKRRIRYRDLAGDVLGTWGRIAVWAAQWANLIGGNISIFIQGGLGVQLIYQIAGNNAITLTEWIAITGGVAMILSQLPTFHSLRYINGVSMITTFLFCIVTVVVSLYQGYKYKSYIVTTNEDTGATGSKNYGVHGSTADKLFGIFTGIVIMSFAYGNTIIPEIQATAKAPSNVTMRGAIALLYTLLSFTYLPVAWVGYWAYGDTLVANGASFLPNEMALIPVPASVVAGMPTGGNPAPRSGIYVLLGLTLIGNVIGIQLYNAPVLEFVERRVYAKSGGGIWTLRNWFLRTCIRLLYIFILALIAALFPYFGDILGLIGALGITPVDFVLPCVMYLKVFKPKGVLLFWNWFIIVIYTIVGVMGCISSIRGIVKDATIYSVFPHQLG